MRVATVTAGARIIDGKALATRLRSDVAQRVQGMAGIKGITPGLAVVLVGDDPASHVYVRNKAKACREAGIHSREVRLGVDTTQAELLDVIAALNADPAIHGILVQLPLPGPLDAAQVINAIAAHKDVDGFHAENVGKLVSGQPRFIPCTPYGILKLLQEERVNLWGAQVVIVGASNIVGKPLSMLLLAQGATVTLCNSKTRDLAAHTRRADVLVAAVGKPQIIRGDMIKPGSVVVDVGINRLENGSLVGDVAFDEARWVASAITPVPGGVGPMTIAMLLLNTVQAAQSSV